MLLLLSCTGSFFLPDGKEAIRTAVVFPVEEEQWVLLANSYLECGNVSQDNPNTTVDEQASARTWAFEQARGLYSREGAVVVVLRVPGPGSWEIGKSAVGTWYQVNEAVAVRSSGTLPQSQPTDLELILEVEGGEVQLSDAWEGSFSFSEPEIKGNFRAEPCDDPNLTAMLRALLIDLAVVAPVL